MDGERKVEMAVWRGGVVDGVRGWRRKEEKGGMWKIVGLIGVGEGMVRVVGTGCGFWMKWFVRGRRDGKEVGSRLRDSFVSVGVLGVAIFWTIEKSGSEWTGVILVALDSFSGSTSDNFRFRFRS